MIPARKIPVAIPERIWGALASIADRRQTDVPALIAEAIADLINADHTYRIDRAVITTREPDEPATGPLAVLQAELDAAREDGWRAPHSSRKAS